MRTVERTLFSAALVALSVYSWVANNKCARVQLDRDMWQQASTHSQWNPGLHLRTEMSGGGMREVADLPCGQQVTLWTMTQ